MSYLKEAYALPTLSAIPKIKDKCIGVTIVSNKLAKDYSFMSLDSFDKILDIDFTNILSCLRSKVLELESKISQIEHQINTCSSECVFEGIDKAKEERIKLIVILKPLKLHYEIIHIISKTKVNEIIVKNIIGETTIASVLYKEQENMIFSPTNEKYSYNEEKAKIIELETVKKFNLAISTSLQSNIYSEIGGSIEILSGKVGGSLTMGLEIEGQKATENREKTIHSDKSEFGSEKSLSKYIVNGFVGIKFLKQFNGVNMENIMYLDNQLEKSIKLETTSIRK